MVADSKHSQTETCFKILLQLNPLYIAKSAICRMSRPTENVHKGQLEHAGGEENWLAICPPSREREMEGVGRRERRWTENKSRRQLTPPEV